MAYGLISSLWSVVFLEYWKREETDLAVQWGVRGVSAINFTRPGFKETKEIQDPVTGETIKWFSPTERLKRQLLQLPLALVSGLALGGLIAACFGIEVFISEVYTGRFKGALIYLPTAILITALPALQTTLGVYAGKLTDYENYQTEQEHERAMVQKTFVFNFITSYLGIFLTAFVYVPFGAVLVPYLNVLSLVAKPFVDNEKHLTASRSSEFHINQNRLRKQVIYFTVTAQIINTITEVILPMIQRRGLKKYQEIKNDRASSQGGAKPPVGINDKPEEASFLARVRTEAALPAYDVNEDLREMVMQFGYLTLFSVVWPLTAVSFLINNWIELRSDALKISMEMQRPIPWRADSIGPWLENLGFLAWLGSITTGALVSLFSSSDEGPDGSPSAIKTGGLLLSILLSEHCYFGAKFLVRQALAQIESPGLQKERRERFTVRKRYLEESLGERAADLQARPRENAPIQVTRQSLEDEARVATTRRVTQADNFWGRQTGWQESVRIGEMIMQRNLGTLGSKKAR